MSGFVTAARRCARETVVLGLWVYVLAKLFVFDIDVYLIQKYRPGMQWVLDFKFFLGFGLLALWWLSAGTKRALVWLAFAGGYPFINLFWRFPRLVAKQKSWTLVIALLHGIVSGIYSARQTFPVVAAYLLLLLHCLVGSGPALGVSASLLLVLMLYSFVRRVGVVFREPYFYRFHVKVFRFVRERCSVVFLPPSPAVPAARASGATSRKKAKGKQVAGAADCNGLQLAVLFNRLALFWARRLRDYQKSGIVLLAHATSVLLIAFVSVFCFAAINYAVYRWAPEQFKHDGALVFFNFLFYSVNNMVFNAAPEVTPALEVAKSLLIVQYASDFAFGIVFVSMIVAHRGQRHAEELQVAIEALEAESRHMEGLIQSAYKMSIEGAVAELQRLKSSLANLVVYLAAQL